ncbi:MAG: hypothetical protein QOK30_3263 [Nocardioidaceae bacterium]|nr:hypothetical protein [Nocardioidaceae bacterium]
MNFAMRRFAMGAGLLLSGMLLLAPFAGGTAARPVASTRAGHVAPAATATAVTRKIVNDCYYIVSRPHHIDWCGNTTDGFRYLRWTSWGPDHARASGLMRVNDCNPDCADGTIHHYAAHVRLHRVVYVNGHPRFSRVSWTFTHRHNRSGQTIELLTTPLHR